jgi:predicted ArsR family transcriptional regulator
MKGGACLASSAMMDRYKKAIAALLATNTREEAAERLGINSRTIRKYFSDPVFVKEYEKAKNKLFSSATQQIQKSIMPAINTLRDILGSDTANEQVKVSAARSILEYGIKLTEMESMCKRIEELENAVKVYREERI